MQGYRRRLAVSVLLVVSVFAGILVVGAVQAPGAFAAGETCAKAVDGAGVSISAEGFVAGDRAAVRRNGKWVTTEDAAGLSYVGAGSIDDVWTLRVRGDALPNPYLEIECASADVVDPPPAVECVQDAVGLSWPGFGTDGAVYQVRRDGKWVASVASPLFATTDRDADWLMRYSLNGVRFDVQCVDDGGPVDPPPEILCVQDAVGLSWPGFGTDGAVYQVRRDGKWVASVASPLFATTDRDADWLMRYSLNGVRFDVQCVDDGGPVDPEPPTPVECRIIQAGLEWDNPGDVSGDYQVRRNGTWSGSESNRYFIGDIGDGDWTVRYRIDGERVESTCVVADLGPCVINGAEVDSILNGAQCAFLETMLLASNLQPGVDEDLIGEPCGWGPFRVRLDCEDGRVTGLFVDSGLMYPDGLRHFADLERLGPGGFGFDGIAPEIGALVNLQEWELASGGFSELPPEVGRLRSLKILDLTDTELVSLPPEIAGLQQLETLIISGTWNLSELPPEIGQLDALKTIFALDTGLVRLPPQVADMESLEVIEFIFADFFVELPAEIWDVPNLKVLRVNYSPLAEIPVAATPPTSLTTVSFSDAGLTGDQTDWLQSLGKPGEFEVFVDNPDCLTEILDPDWNAWVSQLSEDWQNCR